MYRKNLVAAALVLGSWLLPGVARADFITLNPSAPNTGCLDVNAGPCGPVSAGTPAYNTDNVIIEYRGVLDIALSFANGVAVPMTTFTSSTYAESGNLRFETLKYLGIDVTDIANINRNVLGGNYDIYGTFLISGSGIWTSANQFLTTSVSTFSVNLYASPLGGTTQGLINPTSGTDASGGATFGSQDFLLGTASIIVTPTNGGLASIADDGSASTLITALLDFDAALGTSGPAGFFQAPDPFNINIGSQAGSESTDTFWVVNGLGVRIITEQTGGGSLSFTANAVPEPGVLALTAVALVGMGLAGRRRKVTGFVPA